MQALRSLQQLRERPSAALQTVLSQKTAFSTSASETAAVASSTPNPSSRPADSSASARKRAWLASLVVGAATACVVASNTERAPVTGRPQLIFNMYKPAASSDQATAMPEVYSIIDPYPVNFPLWRADGPEAIWRNEVLAEAYRKMSEAVTGLATFDPAFRRCLASVPPKVQLWHLPTLDGNIIMSRTGNNGPFILYQYPSFWHPAAFFHREKATAIQLTTPAGYILQHPTAEELITGIAKEWAHELANHEAERDSCDLLVDMTSKAMMAAAIVSGSFIWGLAIASFVTLMNRWWFIVQAWELRHHQVYEADAIAAAISTASGATPDSITTAMQRAYHADEILSDKAALQHTCQQSAQWHLAKLQLLLPLSQIPQDAITDSTGLQRVTDAAASQISSASERVRAEYAKSIAALEDCVAEELCYLRDPLPGITPHWLDRISRIEKILKCKSFSDEDGHVTASGASASGAGEQNNRYTCVM